MSGNTQPRTFIIDYACLNATGAVIKSGRIKAKHKPTEFAALAGTEEHLKKIVPGCVKMVCRNIQVETIIGAMPTGSPLSKTWNDIFKNAFNNERPN